MKKERSYFDELSGEEFIELMEEVERHFFDVQKQLEIIYTAVRFDEKGYLADIYNICNTGDGEYFVPEGQENVVCRFIEKKKCELILNNKKRALDKKMSEISLPQEKEYVLKAHLQNIDKHVNSHPTILYGFTQCELREPIEYPESPIFLTLMGIDAIEPSDIHDGPFRGALLKGEGVAYSKFKKHIHQLIDDLNEPQTQAPENTEPPKNIEEKVTFEDYLLPHAKKIFPFLLKNYEKGELQKIAYMLFALLRLKYVAEEKLYSGRSRLSNALSNSFKENYERRALSYHLDKKSTLKHSKEKTVSLMSEKIKEAFDSLSPIHSPAST